MEAGPLSCGTANLKAVASLAPRKKDSLFEMENGLYACSFCSMKFITEKNISLHLRTTHSLTCCHCGTLFISKFVIRKHVCPRTFKGHKNQKLRGSCGLCSATGGIEELYDHLFKLHFTSVANSLNNGQFGTLLKGVHSHVPVKSEANRWDQDASFKIYTEPEQANHACYLCGCEFRTKIMLMVHLENHSSPLTMCSLCTELVPIGSHSEMEVHLKTVHFIEDSARSSTVVCQFCTNTYPEGLLYNHILYECDHKPNCAFCESFHTTEIDEEIGELQAHLESAHKKDMFRFGCSACTRNFAHLEAVRTHQCDWKKMKHVCDCGEEFFHNRAGVNPHFRQHLDFPKLLCALCDEDFENKAALKEHGLQHGRIIPTTKQIRINDINLIVDEPTKLLVRPSNKETADKVDGVIDLDGSPAPQSTEVQPATTRSIKSVSPPNSLVPQSRKRALYKASAVNVVARTAAGGERAVKTYVLSSSNVPAPAVKSKRQSAAGSRAARPSVSQSRCERSPSNVEDDDDDDGFTIRLTDVVKSKSHAEKPVVNDLDSVAKRKKSKDSCEPVDSEDIEKDDEAAPLSVKRAAVKKRLA